MYHCMTKSLKIKFQQLHGQQVIAVPPILVIKVTSDNIILLYVVMKTHSQIHNKNHRLHPSLVALIGSSHWTQEDRALHLPPQQLGED